MDHLELQVGRIGYNSLANELQSRGYDKYLEEKLCGDEDGQIVEVGRDRMKTTHAD